MKKKKGKFLVPALLYKAVRLLTPWVGFLSIRLTQLTFTEQSPVEYRISVPFEWEQGTVAKAHHTGLRWLDSVWQLR